MRLQVNFLKFAAEIMGKEKDFSNNKNHDKSDGVFSSSSNFTDYVPETMRNGTCRSHSEGERNDLNPVELCTERSVLLEDQEIPKHKPLTFLRVLRGVLCLMVLVSTAFMTLIFFAPPACLLLRLFSVHYSRKVTSFLFGHWLAMWPFLFEKINGTKVVFAGDHVPPRERVLMICNHQTEVDWMYIWNLALRKDRLGYIKYILKSSVRNAPIFGWGFHILEFILVERKWEVDEPAIALMLSTFKDPQDPLWLILFPEGTDFTEQKCLRSQRFAQENNLPIMKNLLLPRTKGFSSCSALLRGSIDAVYDLTIAYKYRRPLFMDNAFGIDPAEVHIHVRRIPMTEIPTSEDGSATWLIETFRFKDQLLSGFYKEGSFPNTGNNEEDLSTFKCFLNLVVMVGLTVLFSILTFSSIKWVGVYVASSCVYLAAATYFNIRPLPIFGFLRSRIECRKTNITSSREVCY